MKWKTTEIDFIVTVAAFSYIECITFYHRFGLIRHNWFDLTAFLLSASSIPVFLIFARWLTSQSPLFICQCISYYRKFCLHNSKWNNTLLIFYTITISTWSQTISYWYNIFNAYLYLIHNTRCNTANSLKWSKIRNGNRKNTLLNEYSRHHPKRNVEIILFYRRTLLWVKHNIYWKNFIQSKKTMFLSYEHHLQ